MVRSIDFEGTIELTAQEINFLSKLMVKRIAVISTSNHPDYFFYVPIVTWVWNKFGWDVALFVTQDCMISTLFYPEGEFKATMYGIPDVEGVRPGTCAQTVRHFVADVLPQDAYIMVQDIDLIPLKNFWNPDVEKKTIYGWELTGKSFIPVHYTGMLGKYWYEIMGCTGDLKADMERAMKENGRAYAKQEDWESWWNTDWDILTQKFKKHGLDKFTFVPRELIKLAKDPTPYGRIDRYDFKSTMAQEEWLDFHGENNNSAAPEKWQFLKTILERCFGELPSWMDEHAKNHYAKYGK